MLPIGRFIADDWIEAQHPEFWVRVWQSARSYGLKMIGRETKVLRQLLPCYLRHSCSRALLSESRFVIIRTAKEERRKRGVIT
jgi:hypothetical protein